MRVGGGEREIWHLFDRLFLLRVDEATLRERLATRTTNSFGKAGYELEDILMWHATAENAYRRFGAHILDAGRPLGDVVEEMLSVCKATLISTRSSTLPST